MIPPREPQWSVSLIAADPSGAYRYIQELTKSRNAWHRKFDGADAFVKRQKQELAALRGELARLQQALKEVHACWDETNATIAKYQADLDAADSALSAQQAQIRALVEKLYAHADQAGKYGIAGQAYVNAADELSALLIPETPSEPSGSAR